MEEGEKKLTKADLPAIAQYILDGLKVDEACILAGFLPKELKELMERDIGAKSFIEKQAIKYKHEHLKTINKNRSEKSSMWLLENTMPEFGRKKGPESDPTDVFKKLLREIQTNDHSSIIKIEAVKDAEYTELPGGAPREGVLGILD